MAKVEYKEISKEINKFEKTLQNKELFDMSKSFGPKYSLEWMLNVAVDFLTNAKEKNGLIKKKLFNPEGDDSQNKLIGGNITNIIDTSNPRYKWAVTSWNTMMANFWIPQKYSMLKDMSSYTSLTDDEKQAYLKILSFLIYLDSLQTNNIHNIADYVTSPEIVAALVNQQFQEANHTYSYSHILTSVFDKETINKALYYWRDDLIMLKRNKFIASIFQDFSDDKSLFNYLRMIFANYLLESIYFYNGFNFFYTLTSRQKMIETGIQIKFINRDEKTHCVLFEKYISALKAEEPELMELFEPVMNDMMRTAVEQEIEFSHEIIGDKILGMSKQSITQHTMWLANDRFNTLGLEKLYDKTLTNPYKHLVAIAAIESENTKKTNNFEVSGTNYKQASILKDWDKI